MSETYDVIIVGLGAMGSAAACELAQRGLKVLGIDQFTPPHSLGSSHGETRIIREAYFEHPAYVPLVQRAYERWAELEGETGEQLFLQTGGLLMGPAEGVPISGSIEAAKTHQLPFEKLTADGIRNRFPLFCPDDGMIGVYEPRAGGLFVERCIEAHHRLAREAGAELKFEEQVIDWSAEGEGVEVESGNGRYRSGRLILSTGSWMGALATELSLPLEIERQVLHWFEPVGDLDDFSPERCPFFFFEYGKGKYFYGFPLVGGALKIAKHHQGELTTPDEIRREVSEDEVEEMRSLLQNFIPKANGRLRESAVCMYTNTPDDHFIIDHHPEHPQVILASPCSGHGFKFSSVIGELLADMATGRTPPLDLSLFRLERFL